MKYILFLRGINVGGKNKVNMTELKGQLTKAGFQDAVSYINSGNLCFNSELSEEKVREEIKTLLGNHYDFPILFSLIEGEAVHLGEIGVYFPMRKKKSF